MLSVIVSLQRGCVGRYMQGIKFFEPQIMRDTPDAVERDGLSYVLECVASQLGQRTGVPLLDPSAPPSPHAVFRFMFRFQRCAQAVLLDPLRTRMVGMFEAKPR